MKLRAFVATLCLVAATAAVGTASAVSAAEVQYVTVTGPVVRYEPGRTIVIRSADQKEVAYTLNPDIAVPADVKVGSEVTIYTEPNPMGGTQVVRRVTTTRVTAEGNIEKTTEDTRTSASGTTTTTTTTEITGKVEAYQPGRTLTVLQSDGSKVTYTITASSKLPPDLMVGKTITVVPVEPSTRVVRTVTYVTVPPPGN
jgi:hypothetical protein